VNERWGGLGAFGYVHHWETGDGENVQRRNKRREGEGGKGGEGRGRGGKGGRGRGERETYGDIELPIYGGDILGIAEHVNQGDLIGGWVEIGRECVVHCVVFGIKWGTTYIKKSETERKRGRGGEGVIGRVEIGRER
jgi:hypothetical protein